MKTYVRDRVSTMKPLATLRMKQVGEEEDVPVAVGERDDMPASPEGFDVWSINYEIWLVSEVRFPRLHADMISDVRGCCEADGDRDGGETILIVSPARSAHSPRMGKIGFYLSSLFVLLLSSPAYSGMRDDSASVGNQLKATVELAIASWKSATPHTCSSVDMDNANTAVEHAISQMSSDLQGLQSDSLGSVHKEMLQAELDGQIDAVQSASLSIADAWLSGKCADKADAAYRSILETFTGGSYEGTRQRAMVGIDDVRALRQKPTP